MSSQESLLRNDRALAGRPAPPVAAPPAGSLAEVIELRPGTAGALDAAAAGHRGGLERPVRRHALFARLAEARPVTTVTGPAGSGKTWLLRSWLAEAGLDAAWTTVRRDEHDGQRFWESVLDALSGIAGREPTAAFGEARGETLPERVLRTLKPVDEPAVLVIDDLHELRSDDGLAALARALGNLPAHLRVVVLTRVNPALELHRLRVAGALTEIGAADMCFSLEETRELLATSGVALPDGGAAALHERTEGWAAGLRLAAIALAGRPDPERFVAEFCGSERTVASFLRAEVLERQPPEVRDLLLRTSVLERVGGPLADVLTGRSGSLRILEDLDEANAFVAADDVGRSWFRYHPMFADLLRRELSRLDPGLERPLHRAAARWFEQHGQPIPAIRHAQSALDWAHAARLLADHQLELTLDGRGAEVRELLAAFPSDAASTDGELALALATPFLDDGLYEEAAAQIAAAEGLADTVDPDRRPAFDLALATAALRLACARGDVRRGPSAADVVEAALGALRPSDVRRADTHRAAALVALGIAELWALRLADARRHLEHALELARRVGRPSIEIMCLAHLALEATLSGRPASGARPLAERAASLIETCRCPAPEGVVATFAAGGMALAWLGRLVEAEQWVGRAHAALKPATAPALALLIHHTTALVRLGQRRVDDALGAIRDAERAQARLVSEHPLALDLRGRLLRARVSLGETGAARAALDEMAAEERRESEALLVAAALELAEGRPREARDELRPVIDATTAARCCPWAAAIEARLYDAAAGRELGDPIVAEASLEGALALAEPEGTLLPFTLVPVGELLERHGGHRTAHATLLATVLDLRAGSADAPDRVHLLEPLSDAELRIVRYLPGNLKGPEIAAELCVSPNTVRTHLRHIYAKLDAHSRTEAVTRARQLGLLAPG